MDLLQNLYYSKIFVTVKEPLQNPYIWYNLLKKQQQGKGQLGAC
jgi:hypothetical protein